MFSDGTGKLNLSYLGCPHPEANRLRFRQDLVRRPARTPIHLAPTGGESSFEPKLSMMPLIVGSPKGTLYALMFAVPIAILAGSMARTFPRAGEHYQAHQEIMASLPAVLGFWRPCVALFPNAPLWS